MILGLSPSTFTTLHVVVSLIGILSGALALYRRLNIRPSSILNALFLASTLAGILTGFCFPSRQLGLGHFVGVASLLALAPALMALYVHRLAGRWRWIYAGGAATALYFNLLIAVLQAFAKIEALRPLAPTPAAPPVMAMLLAALASCLWLGARACRRPSAAIDREPAAVHIRAPRNRPRAGRRIWPLTG
ncbi:hypothetical protein BH11PSE3_BH11PSE3_30340 [soil metagenome]